MTQDDPQTMQDLVPVPIPDAAIKSDEAKDQQQNFKKLLSRKGTEKSIGTAGI